ncbi:MAG: nucleotidyltransferase family protein [Archaeoglobaceae archaeon]
MRKEEILKVLRQVNSEVQQKYKARIKGIFGSYVRSEEHPESDVDVLVEFEEGADLFHFVGLSLFLEEKLGIKVDVVPYDTIRKEIKDQVFEGAIYL